MMEFELTGRNVTLLKAALAGELEVSRDQLKVPASTIMPPIELP